MLNIKLLDSVNSGEFTPESLTYLREILSKNTNIEQAFIARVYDTSNNPISCGWLFPMGAYGENDVGMYGCIFGWVTAMLYVDFSDLTFINVNNIAMQ